MKRMSKEEKARGITSNIPIRDECDDITLDAWEYYSLKIKEGECITKGLKFIYGTKGQ